MHFDRDERFRDLVYCKLVEKGMESSPEAMDAFRYMSTLSFMKAIGTRLTLKEINDIIETIE